MANPRLLGRRALLLVTLAASGCDDDAPGGPCRVDATSPSVPGVTITVEGERCTFDVGRGGRFTYTIGVAASVPYTAPADVGCGSCQSYGSDPTAFVGTSVGAGETQYCECDVGCCAPSPGGAYALAPGTYEGTIDWPGREWNGPSDTGNPLGDPFPVGTYAVNVVLRLPSVGTVEAALPIVVR